MSTQDRITTEGEKEMPYEAQVNDMVRLTSGCCDFVAGDVVRVDRVGDHTARLEKLADDGEKSYHWLSDDEYEPVAPAVTLDPNRDPVDGDVMYVLVDGPYCDNQVDNRSNQKRGDRVRVTGQNWVSPGNVRTQSFDGSPVKFGNSGWTIRRDQLSFDPPEGIESTKDDDPKADVVGWQVGSRVKLKSTGAEGVLVGVYDTSIAVRRAWSIKFDDRDYVTERWQDDLELLNPDPRIGLKDNVEEAWLPGHTVRFDADAQITTEGGEVMFRVGCKTAPMSEVLPYIVKLEKRYSDRYFARLEFGPLVHNPAYPDDDDEGYFVKDRYSINISEAEEVGTNWEVTAIQDAPKPEKIVNINFDLPEKKAQALLKVLEGWSISHPEALKAVKDALDGETTSPF